MILTRVSIVPRDTDTRFLFVSLSVCLSVCLSVTLQHCVNVSGGDDMKLAVHGADDACSRLCTGV